MTQSFVNAYDVAKMGGIPPYSAEEIDACIFAAVAVSIFILVLCAVSWKKDRKNLFLIPALWIGIFGYLALDYWDRHGTIAALANEKTESVEGCVASFETNKGDFHSSRSSEPDEQWDVGGKHFSYKVTSEAPGYHERELRGGVVHAGQYLRVEYIVSPIFRRQEIMKIDVGAKRCS